MFLARSQARIEQRYDELCREFPKFFGAVERKIERCPREEALALKWMYAAMPWSDRGNYPFETFLEFASHGVWLWEHKEAVRSLPEEIFLNYVLHHRVNEEEIRPCRRLFYEKLKGRLEGLEGEAAALEVNYWCAGEATYQATDERTLSALAVYERGNGRCGEESTFTVNAMRSVGIPARQVYAPRWSHCDDNHAWVEIWTDGGWKFTGACEPEPVLNKGWFNGAASRAMMVHARWFDTICPQGEELAGREGMVTMLNELKRYAPTESLEIQICEADGSPAANARVQFEVLNYAEYVPVATLRTDSRGKACLTTGAGALHLWAQKEERTGELFWDVHKGGICRISLCGGIQEYGWKDCDMLAPADKPVKAGQPTAIQEKNGKQRLQTEIKRREEKTAHWENPQVRMFREYLAALGEEKAAWGNALLEILTEKDQTDCRFEVLRSHLEGAYPYRGGVPDPVFAQYVLNPRVEYEVLTAFRQPLLEHMTPEEQRSWREMPALLWERIQQTVQERPQEERESLVTVPEACLRIGIGSRRSKKILFVAAARALGVPARLNPEDGAVEYWKDGGFVRVLPGTEKCARLLLKSGTGETWKYFQNWSIGRWTGEGWHSLQLTEKKWTEQGELELRLEEGTYRILTANRLPNGNQFAKQRCFSLAAGECRELGLELRKARLEDMLESIQLPDFQVKNAAGSAVYASDLTKGACRILVWLEESREPTEHILNEMLEQREAFQKRMRQMVFVVRSSKALQDPTVQRALQAFPEIGVYYDDFSENVYTLGRKMYVDHEKLPLILVTGGCLNGIYASSGYNVGTADMLLRILDSREHK